MYYKFYKDIKRSKVNEKLINEIEEYVEQIIEQNIPHISFEGYKKYYQEGSRKENEDIYFEKRKQLSSLGVYLQWKSDEKAIKYFNELLWSISNEFTWALAAHIGYGEYSFNEDCRRTIDLFAAETAESLSELIIIHEDKIDKMIVSHIKEEIITRVINPFLEKQWFWEKSEHNWSAVCGSCLGITALLLEDGERQEKIIKRVERALARYLNGFGNDGVSLEGIGYWSYGFGYYIYYRAMKGDLSDEQIEKIKAIAEFPQLIQIGNNKFIPFSDAPPSSELPTGLISFLAATYDIKVPYIEEITSFSFDHCYRWAHLSRNLWWTNPRIFNKPLRDRKTFLVDAQWMIYRKGSLFFAIKGGSNDEPHNHNDVGSFIICIDGKEVITDLGAGSYNKGYFNSERYSAVHTRSYYHSVPLVDNKEQSKFKEKVLIDKSNDGKFHYLINILKAYEGNNVKEFIREVEIEEDKIYLKDTFQGKKNLKINEGLISYIKPKIEDDEKIIYEVNCKENLIVTFNKELLNSSYEEINTLNNYNEEKKVFRAALINREDNSLLKVEMIFTRDIKK